jgi:HEAT repeat protein
MSNPKQAGPEDRFSNDPRSDDDLMSVALSQDPDDSSYWDPIWTLLHRDAAKLLRRAEELCQSSQGTERRLGADILGEIGCIEPQYSKQSAVLLLDMLNREKNVELLQVVLTALGKLEEPEIVAAAARFRKHPVAGVRHGVVQALTRCDDQLAIDCLIELSNDEDSHNRDWATFGLGMRVILGLDTPAAIREALVTRLRDDDFDTRSEAIIGLAECGDRRVIAVLIKELTSGRVGTLAVEAAARIAAPELLPHLLDLTKWWDVDKELLTQAIQACTPDSVQQ